jgi:hypothetical protein
VATAPPPAAPESSKLQTPFVPGSALIAKACARYLLMHCRDVEPGSGRAVACLTDYMKAGNFVGPRCQAALKLTAPLR